MVPHIQHNTPTPFLSLAPRWVWGERGRDTSGRRHAGAVDRVFATAHPEMAGRSVAFCDGAAQSAACLPWGSVLCLRRYDNILYRRVGERS